MEASSALICKSCGQPGKDSFCSGCGQKLDVKRISLSQLAHEVFHFFTHLDKGFPYTLKKLIVSPGHMQREYIQGNRVKHQKPFSMYFICTTVIALTLYWTNIALANYFDAGDMKEAMFFNKYMVMFLVGSLPLSVLLTYLFFYNASYNLAEIGVLILYTISVFFLLVGLINLLKFIWHDLETRYIELPVILIYNTITMVNFFNSTPRWKVILKSVACIILFYVTVAMTQDYLVDRISL